MVTGCHTNLKLVSVVDQECLPLLTIDTQRLATVVLQRFPELKVPAMATVDSPRNVVCRYNYAETASWMTYPNPLLV